MDEFEEFLQGVVKPWFKFGLDNLKVLSALGFLPTVLRRLFTHSTSTIKYGRVRPVKQTTIPKRVDVMARTVRLFLRTGVATATSEEWPLENTTFHAAAMGEGAIGDAMKLEGAVVAFAAGAAQSSGSRKYRVVRAEARPNKRAVVILEPVFAGAGVARRDAAGAGG